MTKFDRNTLDSDHIGRLLFIFTLPAFFAMAVNTLYNVVDTIFIGQYVGPFAIAALSLVFPIQILSIGIGHMAGMGGASLISRSLGAGKIQQAEKAVGNSIMITAVLSIFVTIAGLINVPLLCRWLGATNNTIGYTSDYLFVVLIGMLFMTFGMTLSTLIRAGGNAKVPMIGMISSAVLNIVLDAIFIIPFKMGVKGAAWATVISQILCTIYFLGYYFWGKPALTFRLSDLKPDWKIIKDIFAIGVSALGMTLAGSFSSIIVNRTVVSFGGDMAMSAFGIVNRVMMFAIMPSIVAAQGLQPIIGFNYGAGRFDRVIKSMKIGIFATTLIGVLVYLYVFFKPESVVMIFTGDKELIRLSSYAVKRVFCLMYLIGLINVGATVFQSIGKAVQSFLSTVTRSILFLLPAVLIMPGFMGLDGVWWAFPIADLLTFILVLCMLAPLWFELKKMSSITKAASDDALASGSMEASSQAVA
jgi:putative MATE family efflux protein